MRGWIQAGQRGPDFYRSLQSIIVHDYATGSSIITKVTHEHAAEMTWTVLVLIVGFLVRSLEKHGITGDLAVHLWCSGGWWPAGKVLIERIDDDDCI
jgi:hypothetical protein